MLHRLGAALLVVVPLAGLATPAEASWTAPAVSLSTAGESAAEPVTAVGPGGHVAFVWRRPDTAGDWRVQLRVRSPGGTLSAVQTLSTAGDSAYSPDVAVDASGRVVVVWSQRDDATGTYSVQAKVRSTAGQLSGIKTISAGIGSGFPLSSSAPQVALDPSGDAVVAWQTVFSSGSYRVVARTLSAAGAVAATWQELSRDGANLKPVALAVDDSGVATVAWSRDDGVDVRLEARTRTAAGQLGALKLLSPAGQDSTTPDVAVTGDGSAVIAWVRYDAADNVLYARVLSPAGVLGPIKRISGVDKDVTDDATTGWGEAAVTDGGDAVFLWQQDKPCCSEEVAVRGLSAAGTLSPIAVAGVGYSAQPQVVLDPTGQAILGFVQRDAQFDERIRVRTRTAAGVLNPVQTLSGPAQDANHPDLAVNDAGLVAVTWLRNDGSDGTACCDRVQYVVGP